MIQRGLIGLVCLSCILGPVGAQNLQKSITDVIFAPYRNFEEQKNNLYPLILSERYVREYNMELKQEGKQDLLADPYLPGLFIGYAAKFEDRSRELLVGWPDIMKMRGREFEIREAALKNFSAVVRDLHSPFEYTKYAESMVVVGSSRSEWKVYVPSLILCPRLLIPRLEKAFGETALEEGYLVYILQDELLIMPAKDANSVRMRSNFRWAKDDEGTDNFVSNALYQLTPAGIEVLFESSQEDDSGREEEGKRQ